MRENYDQCPTANRPCRPTSSVSPATCVAQALTLNAYYGGTCAIGDSWGKFRRQHPVEPYVLDFYCEELSLAIELDGGQHNSEEGRQHDDRRASYLAAKGIRIVRFWNHHVLGDTETVLNAIASFVEELRERASNVGAPHPSPLSEGEGAN